MAGYQGSPIVSRSRIDSYNSSRSKISQNLAIPDIALERSDSFRDGHQGKRSDCLTSKCKADGHNRVPRRKSRRSDLPECGICVRAALGTGSVHSVAIDGERSVRVARVEVVQSVERLNPEFQRLVPDRSDRCPDRGSQRKDINMKTFTIENETNNIILHASQEGARAVPDSERFTAAEEFASLAATWRNSRLVEIWNGIPGVNLVKKFKDRATATTRIWVAIQSLDGESANEPLTSRFRQRNGLARSLVPFREARWLLQSLQ